MSKRPLAVLGGMLVAFAAGALPVPVGAPPAGAVSAPALPPLTFLHVVTPENGTDRTP
jgi:hypothetical protein